MAHLGYCPEHDRFYEDMSALGFVSILTRLHGFSTKDANRLAVEALDRVGLVEQSKKQVRKLSHGMRQRLKLAQAIAHHPDFLVLDEPLTGMDPLNRSRTIDLVRKEAARGVNVLVSSHVLHELEAMTDQIILLNQGRVVAEGQVQKIRKLIDKHPHRLSIKAEKPRDLGCELLKHEDVIRVKITKSELVVETDNPDVFYDRIGQLAEEGHYQIRSLVSMDDSMEAVFRYLVQ
jgi:ABC-2 type transport system ATP-binding protein